MIHDPTAPESATSEDTILYVDKVRVNYIQTSLVDTYKYFDKKFYLLRFLYKQSEGVLWCFNNLFLKSHYFREIPSENGIIQNDIDHSEQQQFVEEDDENNLELGDTMWLIVRKKASVNKVLRQFCPQLQQQPLRVRDIIKVGRINFKITSLKCTRLDPQYQGSCYTSKKSSSVYNQGDVTEMNILNHQTDLHQSLQTENDLEFKSNLRADTGSYHIPQPNSSDDRSSEIVCRICLTESESDNELIFPCKCAGSTGIHNHCLREWLNSKRYTFESLKVCSYYWKALECEICKAPFEAKMRSTLFNIMEFNLPNGQGRYDFNAGQDYMILESIHSMPAKVVHVFDLRFDEFSLGRSFESDVKIADVSVSRTHAFIKIRNNQIVLEDNGSKFGTLIKIQRPFPILTSAQNAKSTLIQVGRCLLYFEFKTQNRFKLQCKNNIRSNIQIEETAYLRLRKDNMRIPKEFYTCQKNIGQRKHPLVPILQIPFSKEEQNRQQQIHEIERAKQAPTPSSSISESQSRNNSYYQDQSRSDYNSEDNSDSDDYESELSNAHSESLDQNSRVQSKSLRLSRLPSVTDEPYQPSTPIEEKIRQMAERLEQLEHNPIKITLINSESRNNEESKTADIH